MLANAPPESGLYECAASVFAPLTQEVEGTVSFQLLVHQTMNHDPTQLVLSSNKEIIFTIC